MYSNRSEHSHSRQYGDRSSRQWDDYDDRREPHRDIQRDSHYNYGEDGQCSIDKTSRSREYSDSPKRLYSKDSLNRDRSRKSPARRRLSSPDWGVSEKKRRRFTDGVEDHYRYRRGPEDKASRRSPASKSKDFKHKLLQEEDIKYKKTTQDSRHRYCHEEFTYRQQHDDLTGRRSSGYYKDRDGHDRSQDHSQERTRSQDHSTKYFESDVSHRSAAVPEQKKPPNGFQRFLDVLNKGVNVAMLTKIVTQTSTEVDDRSHSPPSFKTAVHPWSPGCAGRPQGDNHNTSHWREGEGSHTLASPRPRHRSSSPNRHSLSNERSLQRGDGEQSYFTSNSRSRSPSAVEKIMTPEDEHKHKHMQDVLQAIGMNLGIEELGQMSHRIQERLYGKKDSDRGCHRRGSRERDTRRAFSPRPRSRSSSSRSSFSPPTWECYTKEDSYSSPRDVTGEHQLQVHQAIESVQNSSSSTLQESEKCETNSPESGSGTAACQAFSQNPTYTLSEPSSSPVMPIHSPVNCPPLPYPALPPNLPPVGPRLFLPRLPPFLPYPRVPPLNIFPTVLGQTRHLFPQHMSMPQPFFNLPIQPLNTTQKNKTQSRPRCLQVIETKQPG